MKSNKLCYLWSKLFFFAWIHIVCMRIGYKKVKTLIVDPKKPFLKWASLELKSSLHLTPCLMYLLIATLRIPVQVRGQHGGYMAVKLKSSFASGKHLQHIVSTPLSQNSLYPFIPFFIYFIYFRTEDKSTLCQRNS